MVIGTTLQKIDGSPYYSPQFGRGGLAATWSVEVMNIDTSTTLVVTIQHRNEDDIAWTDVTSFPGLTAAGNTQLDTSGLKEVIRIKYIVSGTNNTDSVHFLMQAPSWRPY